MRVLKGKSVCGGIAFGRATPISFRSDERYRRRYLSVRQVIDRLGRTRRYGSLGAFLHRARDNAKR